MLIAVGVISYLPVMPEVHLEPEVVLLGLLPPLLYAAAIQTSLVDFNANRRSILLLSIGLVVFTTVGIAVLVHALLPDIAGPAAFAIGAVVAPPDAVAATAIGRRIGLPAQDRHDPRGRVAAQRRHRPGRAAHRASLRRRRWPARRGHDFVVAAGGGVLVGLLFFVVSATCASTSPTRCSTPRSPS